MTKIAIISQAEQGVLIDISGCSSLVEAKQYLTSTLQVSSQFWEGLVVDLNLGPLVLTPDQISEIQAIVSDVGVQPRQIFSLSPITRASLMQCRLPLGMLNQLQGYASMRTEDLQAAKANELETSDFAVPEEEVETQVLQSAGLRTNPFLTKASEYISPGTQSESGVRELASAAETHPDMVLANLAASLQESTSYGAVASTPLSAYDSPAPSRLSMPNHHVSQALAQGASLSTGSNTAANLSTKNAHISKNANLSSSQNTGKNGNTTKNPAVLMLKQTLRSGQRVSHKGHLVIVGDVNPGAELVADGDITVWGALRGIAHAGASGNINSEIRALKFDAIQLRIAHAIARSPDRNKAGNNSASSPETARVIDGKIRLSVSDPE